MILMDEFDINKLSEEQIEEFSENKKVLRIIKKVFKRMPYPDCIIIFRKIIEHKYFSITLDSIYSKAGRLYNTKLFDSQGVLKNEIYLDLFDKLKTFIVSVLTGNEIFMEEQEEQEDQRCNYLINKSVKYIDVIKQIQNIGNDINIKYNFDKPDLELTKLDNFETSDELQRIEIQITSSGFHFNYPLKYKYFCPKCGKKSERKPYEVASTRNSIECDGTIITNNESLRRCNKLLHPYDELTKSKQAYLYDVSHMNSNDKKINFKAVSFLSLVPGFYECVLMTYGSPGRDFICHIFDVKDIEPFVFELPEQKEDENYIFTLQKACDKYIEDRTGQKIFGLIPIKVALICQSAHSYIAGSNLDYNMQLVGDAGVGKTMILKYYCSLLYSRSFMRVGSQDISVPALRGTVEEAVILGKKMPIQTYGLLGEFRCIYIDEASNNTELIHELKTFLADNNYSNYKRGGTKTQNKRMAFVNIAENINRDHLSLYVGGVKKLYNDTTVKFEGVEEAKPAWGSNSEFENLFKNISEYQNRYLAWAISQKRKEFDKKSIYWIDGYEKAVHDRFPLYFYLVGSNNGNDYIELIANNYANKQKNIDDDYKLMRLLNNNELKNFFFELKKYYLLDEQNKSEEALDNKNIVTEIMDGFQTDKLLTTRQIQFYMWLLNISRIINKRTKANRQDYDFVKYMLSMLERPLDVKALTTYDTPELKTVTKNEEFNISSSSEFDSLPSDY